MINIKRIILLICIISLNLIIQDKQQVYADASMLVYLHTNICEITGENIADLGYGDYILYYSADDIGIDIVTPSSNEENQFLGWRTIDSSEYISQITADINESHLIAVWDNDNIDEGKIAIQKPQLDDQHFEYNGYDQTYQVEESAYYTVSNNIHKDAGRYFVRISLKDKENYIWDDQTSDDIIVLFEIHRYNISWQWSSDYLLAKAVIYCENDGCDDVCEIEGNVTSKIIKQATISETGEKLFSAVVNYNGVERKNSQTVIIPKLKQTLTSADETITISSQNGFRNETLKITEVKKNNLLNLNCENIENYEILDLYNLELTNSENANLTYDIRFNISRHKNNYKDFALVYIDSENNCMICSTEQSDDIISTDSRLGVFGVIGIQKEQGNLEEISTIVIIVIGSLICLSFVLILAVAINIYRINLSRRAIKRY